MAPKAASKKTNGSQQRRPSQSQRARPPSEDGSEPEPGSEEDVEMGGEDKTTTRMANDLVRLAIFNEHRRMPLRRDEINKKVLGSNTRSFNVVFAEANQKLKETFGMEMVELISRGELEQLELGKEAEPNATQGGKKKAAAKGTKSYILRSTLPQTLIEAAAESSRDLLKAEITGSQVQADEEEADDARSLGVLIDWNRSDQPDAIGFLYVLLALILVNGRLLNDYDFRKHLKSFNLDMHSELRLYRQTTKSIDLKTYLNTLIKQGYLDRQELGANGMPMPTQGKRARNADDENTKSEWRWGPRAHAEVGEEGIAEFVADFMAERTTEVAEPDDEEDSDDAEAAGSSRRRRGKNNNRDKGPPASAEETRQKAKESMLDGIMKAAGGKLHPLL